MRKSFYLMILLCLLGTNHEAIARGNWFVTLYGAQYADNKFLDIVLLQETPNFDTSYRGFIDYNDSYLVALAVGKEFARFGRFVGLEIEGQIVKHFGFQDHVELNSVLVLRWLLFPWDKYIDTSFAVGEGLSLAFEKPRIESNERTGRMSHHFLNYLMVELSFALPRFPHWALVGRVHHRSDIYNLAGSARASNFIGGGIKYIF